MKALTVIVMSVIVVGAFAFSRITFQKSVAAHQPNRAAQTQHESPFACDTMAFTPEVRKRHGELGPILQSLKKSVRELPDGYEFEFPADQNTFQMVTEWAIQERLCCPFFDIEVGLDREGGPLWLRLSGREGVKDFIRADGAKWLKQ